MATPRQKRAAAAAEKTPAALIASAARLRFDGSWKKPTQGGDTSWQAEAWDFYDTVGELKFAARWMANCLSQCTLTVEDVGPDGAPAGETTNRVALDALAGLGDIQELLGSFAPHLTVVGECYLVGQANAEETAFDWLVVSSEELTTKQGKGYLDRGDGATELNETSIVIRVWRPHARRYSWADSPTRSALGVLRKIVGYDQHTFATIDSRLAGAGLLILPAEMTFPMPPESAEVNDDPFMQVLTEAMLTPIKDRGAASAVVPIVVRAPAETIKSAQLMRFDQPLTGGMVELEQAAIKRLAIAMDLPPEILLGLGDVNHWGASMVSEAAITTHIEPALSFICDALMEGYLTPALKASGLDPARFVLTGDAQELTQRPDRSKQATEGYNLQLLSAEAWRRENGFEEDDAPVGPESDQAKIMALIRAVPAIAAALLPYVDLGAIHLTAVDVAASAPAEPGAAQAVDPAPDQAVPVEAPPEPVAAITDRASALIAACEVLVFRALELAGNRLRTRAVRGALSEVPRHEVYLHTTPVDEARAGVLLDGAWAPVPSLAASYPGVPLDALTAALHRYTVLLLTTRARHDHAQFAAALREAPWLR